MKNRLKILFFSLLGFGFLWRLVVAVTQQSRTWIDELWVVLNPAYFLLTGKGFLNPQDWDLAIRSWIPPSFLFLFLKFFSVLGISQGPVVLALVRVCFGVMVAASFVVFAKYLARVFQLKNPPLLPVLVLFFNPEFVRFSISMDLNVLGLVPLLFGLWLLPEQSKPVRSLAKVERREWGAFALLSLAVIVRVQYAVFPVCLLAWFLYRRQWMRLYALALIGVGAVAFHFAFDSLMFGRPVLPLLNYFHINAVEGMMNRQGVTPFYHAFEILWRFAGEPVFLLFLIFFAFAFKRSVFLVGSVALFFAIHCSIGNKMFRYYYGAAVLCSGVAAAALQLWLEQHARGVQRKRAVAILTAFVVLFVSVGTWRAVKKTPWHEFEIPSKLETWVGTQSDVKGLITYGWQGIYCGGNYTFQRPLPYICSEWKRALPTMGLNSSDYNYVITPVREPAPCAVRVNEQGEGVAYRCTAKEVATLLGQ